MRDLNHWLASYAESHQNPTNKAIHKICVPAIMFSLLGILWSIPVPEVFQSIAFLNWATLFALACMVFYFSLSLKFSFAMIAILFVMFTGVYFLDQALPLLWTSVTIFVIAWIGQFIGHKIEGKKPSFFEDLVFLLIGPLWVLKSLGVK